MRKSIISNMDLHYSKMTTLPIQSQNYLINLRRFDCFCLYAGASFRVSTIRRTKCEGNSTQWWDRYVRDTLLHFITLNITKYGKYRLMIVMVMNMMTNLSTWLNPTMFTSKGHSAEYHRPRQSAAPIPFCTASDGRMTAECSINCWEISDRGLIQIVSWKLPGGTKENHGEPQS
jgi:hypothetical protein